MWPNSRVNAHACIHALLVLAFDAKDVANPSQQATATEHSWGALPHAQSHPHAPCQTAIVKQGSYPRDAAHGRFRAGAANNQPIEVKRPACKVRPRARCNLSGMTARVRYSQNQRHETQCNVRRPTANAIRLDLNLLSSCHRGARQLSKRHGPRTIPSWDCQRPAHRSEEASPQGKSNDKVQPGRYDSMSRIQPKPTT